MGRGVIDKPKMLKNKRKDIAGKAMMSYAKPAMYDKKIYKAVSGPHGTGEHYHMTRVNTKKGKVTYKDVSKKKAERIQKRNFNKAMKEAEKGYKK